MPFALFAPQPVASVAAAVIIVTQLWLVLSGNFAWLNWLTIVLAASAVDDSAARRVLPLPAAPRLAAAPGWYEGIVLAVTAAVVLLSYRPARNLLSRRQVMNSSFDPLRLVNTYGAFGTVTRRRLRSHHRGDQRHEDHARHSRGGSTSSRASRVIRGGGRRRWRPTTCGWTG